MTDRRHSRRGPSVRSGRPASRRGPGPGLATVTALPRTVGTSRADTPGRGRPSRRWNVLLPAEGTTTTNTVLLAGATALLTVTGLVMVLSASAADAQATFGSPWYHFQRQAVWLAVGSVGFLVAVRFDLERTRRWVTPALFATFGLLVLVLLPVGRTVNGASRWLELGPLTLQPSELAKLVVVLFMADLLARRADEMHDWTRTLRPVVIVFAILAVLILAQPNLGTTTLLGVTVVVVLFSAGLPGRYIGVTFAGLVGCAALLSVTAPYRMKRLMAFADPWADQYNTGYQTLQSQAALANGGLLGGGAGQGRAKYGYLPEGHTDFIFSNIGEEFGLLGTLVVVGMFALITVVGLRVARQAPDRFRYLLAVGIVSWISVQAVVNLGAAVGLLPITGVPLPLVSAGGSSLIITLVACGVLLNISRQPAR
jgi:cell division protein FtsW